MMKRAGKVFADHFHSRLLPPPTELVRAIRYVLTNAAHHYGTVGPHAFSSEALPPAERHALLSRRISWLLRVRIFRAKPTASRRSPRPLAQHCNENPAAAFAISKPGERAR